MYYNIILSTIMRRLFENNKVKIKINNDIKFFFTIL